MKHGMLTGAGALIAMALLIFDAKTGLYGAAQGVELCVRTIVPSLLPFFVLSMLLTSSLAGRRIPFLSPICRACGVPGGAEGMFLTGLLGGYPTGAQCVAQAFERGQLSKMDARRMLGFFSNAGASFLFGIVASRFSRMRYVWALWVIHILSAIFTGMLLPGKRNQQLSISSGAPITLPQALGRSLRVLAEVCGWVILSRVVIAFCSRWFLWLFPDWIQVAFVGLLELANGCFELGTVPGDGLRFLLCSSLISFGGVCVLMQTVSVTKTLGLGMYLPGKLLQTIISLFLAYFAQLVLMPAGERVGGNYWEICAITAIGVLFFAFFIRYEKKCSNPAEVGV